MSKITIAIDGFSSTGKSTVARQLANALEYIYVDSGAMYRAVTLYAIRNELFDEADPALKRLVAQLPEIHLSFVFDPELGASEICMNGEKIEKDIRSMEVSDRVSQVAVVREIREKLVELQQDVGKNKGIVMDGRDIGTVVFPDAELKIFITASPDVRARRRYRELIGRGEQVSYEEVLKNIRERDYIDSHREFSPLKKAEDAIEIDNSELGLEEQFEKVLRLARETIKQSL
ncbi:MAG: (d)CMP kinase [Flavobacteriaceae bacterium]